MIFYFIIISIIIEGRNEVYILINTGYLIYETISSRFIRRVGFECIGIPIRKLIEVKKKKSYINKVIKVDMDIDGY